MVAGSGAETVVLVNPRGRDGYEVRTLRSLSRSARALACAPDGVLIADGRPIGFARFAGAGVVPEPAEPADPPRTDDPLDYQ